MKKALLMILDGWGKGNKGKGDIVTSAPTPNMDKLSFEYPTSQLLTSGENVGLPDGQMGNSEVGHLNIGAGRVVYQDLVRINKACDDNSIASNPIFVEAFEYAKANDKAVHLIGLIGPGGVHSLSKHMLKLCDVTGDFGLEKVYVHSLTDGRDTDPKSGLGFMQEVVGHLKGSKVKLASLIGRYYAMDRDHRWPRVKAAYDLITDASADYQAETAIQGLQLAYERDETDEFVKPTRIVPPGQQPVRVLDGDVMVFMNYRSDRARQITRPFIEPDFAEFKRERTPKLGCFVSLTEYSSGFDVPVAFPPERLQNVFGEYISKLGLHQLRIAETEKYAHVTFFFNGGIEEPYPGEDRILIPSPDVATYDLKPEMSANELTDKLVEAIESGKYDAIICNYANPDMVGHTGNFEATVKAIEALDKCLERVVDSAQHVGGELLITADHGNAEQMRNPETEQAHTAHTSNPVPLIYIGRPAVLAENGALSDIAPTMLHLMGIEKPNEMGGDSLVSLASEAEKPPIQAVESSSSDRKMG